MFEVKKRIAAASMAALMLTAGTAVSPVAAQQGNANGQAGLVNVNVQVTDVIDDVTVTVQDINVAVAAAANIVAQVCGTTVGVAALIAETDQGGVFHCDSEDLTSGVDVTQN